MYVCTCRKSDGNPKSQCKSKILPSIRPAFRWIQTKPTFGIWTHLILIQLLAHSDRQTDKEGRIMYVAKERV